MSRNEFATVGWSDQDPVLALGVVPVGTTEWFNEQPGAMVIPRAAHAEAALVSLLAKEAVRDEPGQDLVLDRLLDLLLVAVLRAWFTTPDTDPPACYRAYGDPVVGPVLRLIHGRPDHPWTVAALAARAGVSRATLARHTLARIRKLFASAGVVDRSTRRRTKS